MAATASISRPLPRPLRLGSTSTGPSGSLSPPPPLESDSPSLSEPFRLGDAGRNVSSPDLNVSTSGSTSSSAGPSVSADASASASASVATATANPRRQSSISYNTGTSSRPSGLGRSNSLGSKAALRGGDGNSGGDESRVVARPMSLAGVRETEPVTLAERHADLLRFIAQKESKCLELRTQLAQHEADLLLLKRKWERIVSKGLPQTARLEGSTTLGSDMLDGIREGVQHGLGKVLAVLEPSIATGPTQGSSMASPPLDSRRPSQQRRSRLESDTITATVSSSKRASIGTTSTSSTRDRSSVSGSLSSSGSLFDELSPSDRQSLASSVEDETMTSSGPESKRKQIPQKTRPSPENPASPVTTKAETLNADDQMSSPSASRKRWPAPSSLTLNQFSYPFSATIPSDLTPLGKQMASWVPPSLNKKWEELKGSETLSKQSKRASVLLNDVFAVLAPPGPSLPKTPAESTAKSAAMEPSPDSGSVRIPSVTQSPLEQTLPPELKVAHTAKEATHDDEKEGEKEEEEWNW